MSRQAANDAMVWVRGATVEDYFDYFAPDGITPIDLTGYKAEMQVRTLAGAYGTTTSTTLLLQLSTDLGNLPIVVPAGGSVPNQVKIALYPSVHAALNPTNRKKVKYAYSLRIFVPAGVAPIYVIPLVRGSLTVQGETVR